MRVTFYSAVLLVAAGSVVLGLDWVSAPMPPMPESKNIVFAPPPPPRAIAAPIAPPPAAPNPAPQSAPAPQRAAVPAAAPPVSAPVAPQVAAPRIKCDIDACAAAYRSFRDTDCTYNPSFGPRRLCT
ncbi:MAG TPA: BA14K family protein, partial [Pseudolabrys sp.]